jgi:hypothetical protein
MKKTISLFLLLPLLALAGGPALVPGKSTVADIEKKRPAEKRVVGGETVYYFPELPWGYVSYAARVGADGKLIAVEQRLTEENVKKVMVNKTTGKEVRDLLGPPWDPMKRPTDGNEIWTYPMRIPADPTPKWFLVRLSTDGVVRETNLIDDMNYNRWGGTHQPR